MLQKQIWNKIIQDTSIKWTDDGNIKQERVNGYQGLDGNYSYHQSNIKPFMFPLETERARRRDEKVNTGLNNNNFISHVLYR